MENFTKMTIYLQDHIFRLQSAFYLSLILFWHFGFLNRFKGMWKLLFVRVHLGRGISAKIPSVFSCSVFSKSSCLRTRSWFIQFRISIRDFLFRLTLKKIVTLVRSRVRSDKVNVNINHFWPSDNLRKIKFLNYFTNWWFNLPKMAHTSFRSGTI